MWHPPWILDGMVAISSKCKQSGPAYMDETVSFYSSSTVSLSPMLALLLEVLHFGHVAAEVYNTDRPSCTHKAVSRQSSALRLLFLFVHLLRPNISTQSRTRTVLYSFVDFLLSWLPSRQNWSNIWRLMLRMLSLPTCAQPAVFVALRFLARRRQNTPLLSDDWFILAALVRSHTCHFNLGILFTNTVWFW